MEEPVTTSLKTAVHDLYRSVAGRGSLYLRLMLKAERYRKQYGSKALAKKVAQRLGLGGGVPSVNDDSVGFESYQDDRKYFDVICAIGCWEGESKRYRVYNLHEGLTERGYSVRVIPFERIGTIESRQIKAKVVVLFRAPFDVVPPVEKFLRYAASNGIKVVYDVDDLVFEPEIIGQIDGVLALPDEETKRYVEGVRAYRKLLLEADSVTVPTEFLASRVRQLGKDVAVIPNSINGAQFRIANQLDAIKKEKSDVVRIGYFSGSKTHQRDFLECADALYDVMQECPDVRLRIVGHLEVDARFLSMADRVEQLDFQPYEKMLEILAECDINLAPLELGNAYCDAKSELKFFEAALLGVPTVASGTDTFTRAISNGSTGYLAHSREEWYQALKTLVQSRELRASIGSAAHLVAVDRYGIGHVSGIAAGVYGLDSTSSNPVDAEHVSLGLAPGRLTIAWVIPKLIIGGGGHRNILRAAYFLSQFGHNISLYFMDSDHGPTALLGLIREHFYPLDCSVYLYEGTIHAADVVFATHWTTVSAALTARQQAKEIMYFVQDFEPAFTPMGSDYVLAENTYRRNLYHITSGPWCESFLRKNFDAEADHFRFPVDRSIYYPRLRTKTNRNLIFFSKPEMPRRCFELGVMALAEFHYLRPDVEIIMFGSKYARNQEYSFPVSFRDVLPTLDDLAEMYSNGDVGLVFSTTNPSLIPYEMMACGLPVIDLDRGDNEVNYAGRYDIALLASPLPEKMASEIAGLIDNPDELARRRANGLDFVGQFPSEEGMARRIESLITQRLDAREASQYRQPSAAVV